MRVPTCCYGYSITDGWGFINTSPDEGWLRCLVFNDTLNDDDGDGDA